MNGGYLMVSKADTKIYDKLQIGLKIGKPILWYETETECYYIDSISGGEITSEIVDDEEVITYGDIILTKGGKTITVSYDGTDATVTEEGDIANPVMENIKDKNGNLRFVEDELELVNQNITSSYAKFSLSGTHLMIVALCKATDGTTVNGNLFKVPLPEYILNKITTIVSTTIDRKVFTMYGINNQNLTCELLKDSNNVYIWASSITLTSDKDFRIQFDLLIDAE